MLDVIVMPVHTFLALSFFLGWLLSTVLVSVMPVLPLIASLLIGLICSLVFFAFAVNNTSIKERVE